MNGEFREYGAYFVNIKPFRHETSKQKIVLTQVKRQNSGTTYFQNQMALPDGRGVNVLTFQVEKVCQCTDTS